jgi:hypothetical protein
MNFLEKNRISGVCPPEMSFPRITWEQAVHSAKEKAAPRGGLNFFRFFELLIRN